VDIFRAARPAEGAGCESRELSACAQNQYVAKYSRSCSSPCQVLAQKSLSLAAVGAQRENKGKYRFIAENIDVLQGQFHPK